VGVLIEALGPGVRHRWDEVNALLVRVEGRAPESRSKMAVFAGANAAAVETAAGWEILQFRTAELVGDEVWRLTGLLRGQQGTEAAGADSGAVAVLLDQAPARAESIWRAGPLGGPAGGAGVSEVGFTMTGMHDRPWSPAHLWAKARTDGGLDLGWIARSRIDGDRWDGEAAMSDPLRFRVRVLEDSVEKRVFEVEGSQAVYAAGDLAADFPGGLGARVSVAVAQWGEGYGWGAEAAVELIV
jgi:hypothetical protein